MITSFQLEAVKRDLSQLDQWLTELGYDLPVAIKQDIQIWEAIANISESIAFIRIKIANQTGASERDFLEAKRI